MSEVLFNSVQLIKVSALKPYDKNPRKGNVRAIAESLSTNKQYRPIVVQKNTYKILAGNHTWQAAKALGWSEIAVVFVDVDDDQAKRIVLADNRTNDLADYDNRILAELLKDLQTPEGTGYSQTDMDALLNSIADASDEAFAVSNTASETSLLEDDPLVTIPTGPMVRGTDEDGGFISTEDEDAGPTIDDAEEDLSGVYTLKDDMLFPGSGYWEVPRLRDDMMIEELPHPLTTWAGSATRDMGWDGYWLYNWGIDSTSGMTDLSKIMLSFYAHDEYFENWWYHAARHMSKVLNAKIKYAITPNFSQDGLPMALSLWQLFRSRWVGRYLQEIGVRVMPDMEMVNDDSFIEIAMNALPKELKWAATQAQNISATSRRNVSKEEQEAEMKRWVDLQRKILARKPIENLLVYCHPNSNDKVSELYNSLGVDVPNLVFMPTRLSLLSKRVKANEKDEGRL